jgi:hypothetical protein
MAFRKSAGSASKRAADIFNAADGHAKENGKKPSVLMKLFKGELKLLITFWTFCISLPLLGDLIFTQLVFPLLDVESSEGTAAMFVWGTFMLVYGIIASIGLWRSACRYTGPSHWALLAKACAVLGMGASVAYALMWYGSWMILTNA